MIPKKINNILEAIGNTPLVRMNRIAKDVPPAVYAKVEYMNPGGSIKDRVAVAMIDAAERSGELKPGGTIIEATSGNTGVGLALAAAVKGYRCIFIMPDKMSDEKTSLLRAYGAEVIITPTDAESNSPEGYGGVAARLFNEIPNAWRPDQFSNLSNPEYHYRFTGPEIWEQTEGRITAFAAGIGTGGTISGVGKFLKEKNPNIKIVAADPEGSILSGDKPKPWLVEGIGEDFVPKTFNSQVVDEWIRVTDAESFLTARKMARLEGLLVGGSCGTCMTGALKYAQRLTADDLIVALCPDTGRNYLSKMYNDEWMVKHGYTERSSRSHTVGDLIDSGPHRPLISVAPHQPAQEAINIFREHGFSQLPVIKDNNVVGSVQEVTLARLLHERKDPHQITVQEIMARPLPQVDESMALDEVYRRLMAGNSGVIVTGGGKIKGIVTRIDLVEYWDPNSQSG